MANGNLDEKLLRQRFKEAYDYVSVSDANYTVVEKLKLYSLYKQATEGDCKRVAPSKVSLVRYTKWKAWTSLKGLSSIDCMKQYLDLIMKKEPHLVVVFDYTTHDNILGSLGPEELLKLPKINLSQYDPSNIAFDTATNLAPPRSLGLRDATRVSHAVGVNPFMNKEDDPLRIELYDRLRLFYEKYNKKVLQEGIGHIVDFGMEFGEEKLNIKLKATYGVDLNTLEDDNKRLESIVLSRIQNYDSAHMEGIQRETDPVKKKLRMRLLKFFKKVDPNVLDRPLDPLVEFVDQFGEVKLNLRLFKMYNSDLNSVDNEEKRDVSESNVKTIKKKKNGDKSKTPIQKTLKEMTSAKQKADNSPGGKQLNRTLSDQKKPMLQEMKVEQVKAIPEEFLTFNSNEDMSNTGRQRANTSRSGKSARSNVSRSSKKSIKSSSIKKPVNNRKTAESGSLRDTRPKDELEKIQSGSSVTGLKTLRKPSPLPENTYEMLEYYYFKYDPIVTVQGGVDTIFEWGKRNGYALLNRELKKRYNESLREFIARSELLKDELETFYEKFDPRMLNVPEEGIDKVYAWGLRNGRIALNKQLLNRYGSDLDGGSKTDKALDENKESYF